MKVVLTILCALVVLFGGGCGFILLASSSSYQISGIGTLTLLPLGLAAVNVLAIGALWGKFRSQKWAVLVLSVLDGLIVAFMLFLLLLLLSSSSITNPSDVVFLIFPIVIVATKGLLSFFYWRRI